MPAALHTAARAGDSAQVRNMLAAGTNPNEMDEAGDTPSISPP